MNKTIYRIIAILVLIFTAAGLFFYYSTKMSVPAGQTHTNSTSVPSNIQVDNSF